MRPSRLLAAAVTAAALLAAPTTAQGAIAWQPCPDPGFGAFECARAPQPLDRASPAAGTVDLFVRRLRAPAPTSTALVALAGGPGQAATPIAAEFATALAPGLKDRDLLVFDQRGTGRSGALECDALARGSSSSRAVTACANELGARRGFYRTADSVDDLEALRVAGGYAKLAIFGVSYGTKVALDYAAKYPQNVERLVLDSVVLPEGPDPLQRSSFRAVSRVLDELCSGDRCDGATPSAVRDVRTLVRRGKAIRGTYVDGRGRKRRGVLAPETIFSVLTAGDVNPAWRALTPGALRAAVKGDTDPLIRLAAASLTTATGSRWQSVEDADSSALFLATICEEGNFPWTRTADPATRAREARAALLAQPQSAFTPFGPSAATDSGVLGLCASWPTASPPPAPPGPLPAVPTLILAGSADLRTPAEDAAAAAAKIPGTALVTVPNVGHSVVGVDASGCAGAAIAGFFNGQGVAPCPDSEPLIPPLPRPATSLGALRPTGDYKGRVGRTLTAVLGTRADAAARAVAAQFDGRSGRFGGLRGGTISVSGDRITLRSVTFVPGVQVSGTMRASGNGTLRVRGSSAARGTLTFSSGGQRLTGRLSGTRVRLRARARAASATPVPADAKAPFPALVRAAGATPPVFTTLR